MISLACETIQLDGEWTPFGAALDQPVDFVQRQLLSHENNRIVTEGRRPPAHGGTFVFVTGGLRYVVPPFTSKLDDSSSGRSRRATLAAYRHHLCPIATIGPGSVRPSVSYSG